MHKSLIFIFLLAFAVSANAAPIYKWVDEGGVVNFTDDYDKVPAPYRDRVEVRDYLTEGVAPSYSLSPSSQKETEAKTDLFGRDETWWREKVSPWKEQLKEASKNYENVQKEYMAQAQGLSPYNFGKMSLTQYQMLSARLQVLNSEMEEHQTKIAEAKAMLGKLAEEARESKADPAWLK
ncbi:MAG: DUF4124 domain-containing protein [Thermodesulfobacteriota bacterium]